jgi:hypothetical protein
MGIGRFQSNPSIPHAQKRINPQVQSLQPSCSPVQNNHPRLTVLSFLNAPHMITGFWTTSALPQPRLKYFQSKFIFSLPSLAPFGPQLCRKDSAKQRRHRYLCVCILHVTYFTLHSTIVNPAFKQEMSGMLCEPATGLRSCSNGDWAHKAGASSPLVGNL